MGASQYSMLKTLGAVALLTPLFIKMEQSRQLKKKLDKNPNFLSKEQQARYKESVKNDLFFYGILGGLVSGVAKNFISSGMSSLTYYIMNNVGKKDGAVEDTELEKHMRDTLRELDPAVIAGSPELTKAQALLEKKDTAAKAQQGNAMMAKAKKLFLM